ncbi:MAG: hypothetical protein QOG52_2971 [Frankiaceae bacterium]|nr:hypothetical protein [Frankiaceae bacterium]
MDAPAHQPDVNEDAIASRSMQAMSTRCHTGVSCQ